jgi:hypothetical protein
MTQDFHTIEEHANAQECYFAAAGAVTVMKLR